MKTALLTLNIGDCLDPNTRDSFKDACRRWHCEYVEVTEAWDKWHPHAMKLAAFELCDADRVFYIDADTAIRGDTPSPFET